MTESGPLATEMCWDPTTRLGKDKMHEVTGKGTTGNRRSKSPKVFGLGHAADAASDDAVQPIFGQEGGVTVGA